MDGGSGEFHPMDLGPGFRASKDCVFPSQTRFPMRIDTGQLQSSIAVQSEHGSDSSAGRLPNACVPSDPMDNTHTYFHSSSEPPSYSRFQCTGNYSEFSQGSNRDNVLNSVVRTRRRKAGISDEERICIVCGEPASGYNFDRLTCESCKAFFRRNALKPKDKIKACSRGGGCAIEGNQRKHCPSCRLKKCFTVGMKPELILPPEKLEQRAKPRRRKQHSPQGSSCSPQHSHHHPHLQQQQHQQQHIQQSLLQQQQQRQQQQLPRPQSQLAVLPSHSITSTGQSAAPLHLSYNIPWPSPAGQSAVTQLGGAPNTPMDPHHHLEHQQSQPPAVANLHFPNYQSSSSNNNALTTDRERQHLSKLESPAYRDPTHPHMLMDGHLTTATQRELNPQRDGNNNNHQHHHHQNGSTTPLSATALQTSGSEMRQQQQLQTTATGRPTARSTGRSSRLIPCRRSQGRTSCRHPRCRRAHWRQIRNSAATGVTTTTANNPLIHPGLAPPDPGVLQCLRECVQRIREPFTPDEQLETGVAVTLEQEYNRMDVCIRRIIRVVKLLPYFGDIGKPAQLTLLRNNIYGLIVLYSSFFFERGIRKLRYPVIQADGQLSTVTVSMLDEVVTPTSTGTCDVDQDLPGGGGGAASTVSSTFGSKPHSPSANLGWQSRSSDHPRHSYATELREEFELYKANTLAAFDHLDQLVGTDDILRVSVLAIKLFTYDCLPADEIRASVSSARQAYLLFLWAYLRWRVGPKRLRSATELYARLLIAFIDLRTLEIRMTEFAKLLSLDGLSPLMREVCSQRTVSTASTPTTTTTTPASVSGTPLGPARA